MACKRSAVRSRLAPPALARFASFGWASHVPLYRSEVSEGCRAEAAEQRRADHQQTTLVYFLLPHRRIELVAQSHQILFQRRKLAERAAGRRKDRRRHPPRLLL